MKIPRIEIDADPRTFDRLDNFENSFGFSDDPAMVLQTEEHAFFSRDFPALFHRADAEFPPFTLIYSLRQGAGKNAHVRRAHDRRVIDPLVHHRNLRLSL